MANQLLIKFGVKNHPYPEDAGSVQEAWGKVDIIVHIPETAQKILLLSTEWDVATFAEWFVINWNALCYQSLSLPVTSELILPWESIAQAINRLQQWEFAESEDNLEDEWFSALYTFRESHSLHFALRGSRIPEIFIGINHGNGEVSCASEGCNWFYGFDMRNFCEELRQNLQQFFLEWLQSNPSDNGKIRIQTLLTQVEHKLDCGCCYA